MSAVVAKRLYGIAGAHDPLVANAIAEVRASVCKKRSRDLDPYAGNAGDVVDPFGTRATE